MKLLEARIRNSRRLEDVSIEFEETETVFVCPNNSGNGTYQGTPTGFPTTTHPGLWVLSGATPLRNRTLIHPLCPSPDCKLPFRASSSHLR